MRRFSAAVAGALAALVSVGAAGAAEVVIAPGLTVEPLLPRGIRVRVTPRPAETWAGLARRVTGRFANAEVIRGSSAAPAPDPALRVVVPFELLTPSLKREAVAGLLPGDRCEGSAWAHRASPGFAPDGSFEDLALWFSTGPMGAAALELALRDSARRDDGVLRVPCVGIAPWLAEARGCCVSLTREEAEDMTEASEVEAPGRDLLLPDPTPSYPGRRAPAAKEAATSSPAEATAHHATAAPAGDTRVRDLLAEGPPPAPRRPGAESRREGAPAPLEAPLPPLGPGTAAARRMKAQGPPAARLVYGRDEKGAYASYRLRPGEAIYSDVIVRFTGRVHAREVNEIVPVIAERSAVRSFASLPVGFEVKVPLELLADEFLPRSDPKRRDYERRREEVSRYRNRSVAAGLEGVAVLLDAGHGGRDRGASFDDVWESDYVYDIMCRIKRRLERTTRAKVFTTVRNERLKYVPQDRQRLQPEPDTFVLTHPPYRLEDPVVGVNLRWYLANSLYRTLVKNGTHPAKVVFTSLHADSLHPTVRGAMVYVPAEEHTGGRHGRSGSQYDGRMEVQKEPVFTFSARERQQAEGLSRELAARLLEAFDARGLPVHEESPVRGSVLRNRREWLPAVLRSNRVPVRVLLEVCNLNHPSDNELLESPAFRQGVADAYVDGLLRYYGGAPGPVVAERR